MMQSKKMKFVANMPGIFGDSALIVKGRIKTTPNNQWVIGRDIVKSEEIEPLKLTMEKAEKDVKEASNIVLICKKI